MMTPRKTGFVPGAHMIDAHGKYGFCFADMSHQGSIMALPSGIYAWPITDADQLNETAFADLWDEPVGAVEYFLIGTGVRQSPITVSLRSVFRTRSIVLEVMASDAALRVYNICVSEKRRVGAALIGVP